MHHIPEEIFRAYDIRGLYPEQLNDLVASRIGTAAAAYLDARTLVVGRDMRTSSNTLFGALVEGITSAGVDVVDVGLVSTPLFYFAVWHLKARGGIMITASHNPKEYNGFKVCREEAIPVNDAELREMMTMPSATGKRKKGRITQMNVLPAYAEHVLSFVRDVGDVTIAVDAANGMGGAVFPRIIGDIRRKGAGVKLIPLYCEPDGTFPHHEADPLKPKNLADLQRAVRENKAGLGAGFDGDADRVILVDETGDIIRADYITALLSREFLRREPGSTIVYDLRSSRIVRETIEGAGGRALRCRVGHAFIKKTMRQEGAVFGGELSGHYYVRKGLTADNGDIPVLMVMELMMKEKKPLSELVRPFRKYRASGEINSTVPDPKAKMQEIAGVYAGGRISCEDGILVEFDDWWFNIRESNTEPLLRLNLEADTPEKMERRRDEVLSLIRGK